MIQNYLLIAFRTLRKHLGHTVINVVGLALGLAACLLIALFIRREGSYDEFHDDANRIVQVLTVTQRGEQEDVMAYTPIPLADALEETFPQIEHIVRLKKRSGVVRQGETAFEEDVLFAGRDFFRMFSFELRRGDPGTVLDAPDNVVLTPAMARKYFGTTEVIGRRLTIRLEGTFYDFTVAGLARPAPGPSSIQYDVLVPFSKLSDFDRAERSPTWKTLSPLVYAQLHRPEQANELAAQLPAFVKQYVPEDNAESTAFRLLPITETHLTPDVYGQLEPTSNPLYAYVLSGVALFILLIACINFITLAIGQSEGRAQEVGVRKTMGAGRGEVMRQFWGEALLLCGGALVLSLGLARMALPVFNRLVNRSLSLDAVLRPEMGLVLLALLLIVGGLAGGYPAVVLSRFQPVAVLRGPVQGGGTSRLVQALVVVQFVLSIGLIIGTVVMWQQLDLLHTKNLGFQKEHIVQVDARTLRGQSDRLLERYRAMAATTPALQHVTGSWGTFGVENAVPNRLSARSEGQERRVHAFRVHYDVVDALGLTLKQGRDFSRTYGTDAAGETVLVNETLVQAFGWEHPIGKQVSVQFTVKEAEVVGVVKDFHFQSLRHEIEPLVMHMRPIAPTNRIYARIAPGRTTDALKHLKQTWSQVAPDLPFSFTFLDEMIEQQYRADERWARIVSYAAGFAIFIACLGLFGLATLAAQRRTKEIGIRKVLGASAKSIVMLLSRDFLKLIGMGFVVAVPLAYWAAQRWLQDFAYRIELDPWTFAAVGAGVAALALCTVSTQALRAALTDPAEALRYE